MNSEDWLRVISPGFAPVAMLLLTSLLSPHIKAVLVYQRFVDTLPGHRAFSVLAPRDPRINLESLVKNIGTLPVDGKEQNTKWYMLYKKVESEMAVMQANQHYLLFRDLAALSLLATLFSVFIYILGIADTLSCTAFVLFLFQYLATRIAAENNGNSLVTNVLALHSSKCYV